MEGLTVSDQQQPATVADTHLPNSGNGSGGALLGPTAIPSDEGEESSRLLSSFGSSGEGGAVLLQGLESMENTPRNVTTDYDTFDGDDDVEGGVVGENEAAEENEDDESDYSYTYDDEDDGQFTGFLIPTEPFETTVAVAATATAATSFATAASGGAAVVVAEDCAASSRGLPSSNSTTTANASNESWGKPLPPHTISRATSAMDSYITSTTSTNVLETNPSDGLLERKQKWREPTRAAVNMSLRAEKEKTGGRRRLASDLYKIMTADTNEAGFSLAPSNDDSMDKWCIKLFGFDEDSNLAKDLLVCGVDHVELEMSFPDQYPFEPPFVRVVKPRFKKQTGFVMSGALCMELLTKDGWNPINDIESVIVSIRSLMVVGDGRLQAAVDMGNEEYEKVLKSLLDIRKSLSSQKQDELEDDAASDADDEEEDCDTANARGVDAKRKRAPSDDSNGGDSSSKSGSNKPSVTKKASSGGAYTVAEAKSAYDHLSKYHKQEGWDKNGWWSRKG
jgi:ubiquitin-protein ligase